MSKARRYGYTMVVFTAASLLVVIYSLLSGGDRIDYTLPDLPIVDPDSVREIVIDRANGEVTLARTNAGWVVRPGDYPAHLPSVEFLLDAMVNLSITDVVSTRNDPGGFDLDDDNRVSVALIGAGGRTDGSDPRGEILREIDIGRLAATYGHTYVRVSGDNRILQARGQLRVAFDRNVEILRDKSVFAFDPSGVTEIVATLSSSDSQDVRRIVLKDGEWRWENGNESLLAPGNSEPIDSSAIESALSFFGSLPAYRFRYEGETLRDPWLVVEFSADKRHILSVYELEGNLFAAETTDSDYEFQMAPFQVSFITEPLGIEHPAK